MGQAHRPVWPAAGRGSISAGIGLRVMDLTRRSWTRYWARRAERATVAILRGLDDRALKDIGFDRSEIESVVYGERSAGGGCCRALPSERRVRMC